MFECIINLGADSNSYVRELLEFCEKFVDQKKRQLRLNAFAIVNKIPAECPRSKIAVLKRAYRKTPSYGFCPSPESKWGDAKWEDLRSLEAVLHYFYATCKDAVAALPDAGRQAAFLANLDCAAAEAFVSSTSKDLFTKLCGATSKYYCQLINIEKDKKDKKDEKDKSARLPAVPSDSPWMVFTDPEAKPEAAVAARAGTATLMPRSLSSTRQQVSQKAHNTRGGWLTKTRRRRSRTFACLGVTG